MFMPHQSFVPLLALLVLALPLAVRAEEIVTTTDGRQLLLRDDGSFQFLTGKQRWIPVNPYLSNTNPYLGAATPTRSPYATPAPLPASVPSAKIPAAPGVPEAPQAKAATPGTEEKPKGFMGVLDDWIDEKKSKKSRIRK
ncbi:MAG TPA: hypothetical protein DCP05_03395 [Rhodospirillaceae bacterium]|nr:hypothetical protein [Rhodospirillaceae bacterium]HAQ33130.1 hypothetical protein [Rhodospirillaceae bacterium]